VLADFEVVFVGVRCAPAELAQRERLRGDREPGLAQAQQELVRAHGRYDIECDTTTTSPLDCALTIRDFLARPDPPTAFDELRTMLAEGAVLPP
jgi:chloramphenicol 3-O phosphotransferase